MSPAKRPMALAQAAMQDIISCGHNMASANIRGEGEAEQVAIREKAHALVDAYLDHMADAGRQTAGILED
jgi:hypothetical protein